MKKKVLIGTAIAVVVVLGVIFAVGAQMFGLFETLPEPEIKSGEFDFSLTYEVDGKREKIEGTYVCEFEGVERVIDGISREWKGYIEGHEENCIYEIKEIEDGTIKIDLDLHAEFFMSDPFYKSNENSDEKLPEPMIFVDDTAEDPSGETAEGSIGDYKGEEVKIISFEYDEPIENKYE